MLVFLDSYTISVASVPLDQGSPNYGPAKPFHPVRKSILSIQ